METKQRVAFIKDLTIKFPDKFTFFSSFDTEEKRAKALKEIPWNFKNDWKKAGIKRSRSFSIHVYIPGCGSCIYDNVVVLKEQYNTITDWHVFPRLSLYDGSISSEFGVKSLYNGINHIAR